MDSDGFSQKLVNVGNRNFSLRVLMFANGCFVTISEGEDRLGSMAVTVRAGPTPATTEVIPSRSGSLFLRLAAEQVSARVGGIAIVSSFVQGDIGRDSAKALMEAILDMMPHE